MSRGATLAIAVAGGALTPFVPRPEVDTYVPLIRLMWHEDFWSASGVFYALFAGQWVAASALLYVLLRTGMRLLRRTSA
ncbi:MAG TPA: hypothetical protein VFL57_08935 [Bryobacteraceae bacterium]|nr:hypothetical protein [Bryobacteraceae bacterium]